MTRKTTFGIRTGDMGRGPNLCMGNLDSLRDWGHDNDYVRLEWMMLQQDVPEDLVIATGVHYSEREFISWKAAELGLEFEFEFEGEGTDEVARITFIVGDKVLALSVRDVVMRIDPRYFRPVEADTLLGDPTKAKEKLGWVSEITAQEMCAEIVEENLKAARRAALLKEHGLELPVSVEG